MTVLNAALTYAAHGWAVLPLYQASEGRCACGKDPCKSAGKHPRFDLVEHGVKDATIDPDVITSWPKDINLGVALGEQSGGIMVFDVDDREVAANLMHPDVGLQDETGLVFTGRKGCHIWFHVNGDTATFHVKARDGPRLGEVRGDGSYVVVPPSVASTGRQYRWIGRAPRNYEPPTLAVRDSALEYVTSLLSIVKVNLADVRSVTAPSKPAPKDPIYAIDIPAELVKDSHLSEFRMALASNVQLGDDVDRSGRLFALSNTLAEVAVKREFAITPEQIAGVVKQYDNTVFARPKYASRVNPDQHYWQLATEALEKADIPVPSSSSATPSTVPVSPDYTWDQSDGALYLQRPRSVMKVSNFRPQILEDIEIDYGLGAAKEMERSWHVRFTLKDGRSHEFHLSSGDNRPGGFEVAITKACPVDYIVAAGMYPHLKVALQELSPEVKRRRVFATTGWIQNGGSWVFLLPGAEGGMGAEGIDPTIRIDHEYLPEGIGRTLAQLGQYGVGVRPPTAGQKGAAWAALRALVESGNPGKTYPIVLQVFAGPLSSAGLGEVPPLVHVMGKTGSLKTSFTLAALSLFGSFTETTTPPASWSSTINFVQNRLHVLKDLTLLVDDFKRGVVGSKKEVTRLVNNYADRSGRGRATREGDEQVSKVPRGIMLSNGEDVWEDEASASARTIVVDLLIGDIEPSGLAHAQTAVKAETMALVGGAYLTWLAGEGQLLDGDELPAVRAGWHARLMQTSTGTKRAHLRLLASLSSLFTVHSLVSRFVRDTFGPDAAEIVRLWGKEMLVVLMKGLVESAEKVAEASPYEQVASALRDGMSSGVACFVPARGDSDGTRIPPRVQAEPIGYYWLDKKKNPDRVLLTRNATFAWFERSLARRRGDSLFSWRAFVREAVEEHHGTKADRMPIYTSGVRHQLSGVILALDELLSPDVNIEGISE